MRFLLAVLLGALYVTTSPAQELGPRRWTATVNPSSRGGETAAVREERRAEPTTRLIVRFRAGVAAADTRTRASSVSARVEELHRDLQRLHAALPAVARMSSEAAEEPRILHQYSRVYYGASVRVRRELRDAIARLSYIASVHDDVIVKPLLASSVTQIGADKVWEQYGTRGAGIKVAVIDTGIDYMHPALGGGIGDGFKVIGGWDFVDGDDDPMDTYGHGTHVAGIVAANGGGLTGVAPEASLVAYRALEGQRGNGSDVLAAIERAVDPNQDGNLADRADVVNMSLGGMAFEDDPLVDAVESATAAGVVFCIAAGNSGDFGNLGSPGVAPSAITVGASDRDNSIAYFSARGPSFAFGIKPEVVAPGVGIVSSSLNGTQVAANGTSMASPHVAGVAALVRAARPQWTPADVKSAIVSTAHVLDAGVMSGGAGRLDALRALSTDTLVSPTVIDFGQLGIRQEVWSSSRTVVLRNVSAEPRTLTATIHGAGNGIVVTVDPPSVTLAPGESANVAISTAVTNGGLPAPPDRSFSFGGRIEWSGGAVPVHLPWSLVRGAFLRVEAVSDEECFAWVVGARQQYEDFFYGLMRVFWPLETVDVLVQQLRNPSAARPYRNVLAENVDLSVNQHVVIDPIDAQFTMATSVTDDSGNTLISGDRLCAERFVLAFPQGRKVGLAQEPGLRDLWGPMSDRVRIYTETSCADVERSTVYAVLHPPVHGLSSDLTRTLAPQWRRQEVRFAGDEKGHLTTTLFSMRFPGPLESYFVLGGWHFLMRPTPSTLTIYYTPSPAPEVDLWGMLERWGKCFDPAREHEVDCPTYQSTFFYLNEDVRVERDLYLDTSPMAYRVPPATPLTIGAAPVSAAVGLSGTVSNWEAWSYWYGPAGESKSDDDRHAWMSVRDAGGRLLAEGLTAKGTELLSGAYRIDAVNTRYSIAGIQGKATSSAWIDTTKSDRAYPQFFGVRIMNGDGAQVTTIARNGAGTLRFAAADPYRDGVFTLLRRPREEAARVEYRLSGTADWKSLTPVVEGRHYENSRYLRPGVGTVFSVDLSPAAAAQAGAIDVRIRIEDDAGNVSELLLEPAFLVGSSERRRAVRK